MKNYESLKQTLIVAGNSLSCFHCSLLKKKRKTAQNEGEKKKKRKKEKLFRKTRKLQCFPLLTIILLFISSLFFLFL